METQGWTSGNENVDNFIKEFQLKALAYTKVIEWIPFDRLNIIQKIGKGGFGSVYSATWLDGIRKIDYVNECYVRTRESSSEVALKTLPSFEENLLLSLKEFNNHIKCSLMGIKLKIYGLTQDEKTKEYMMVAQYADNGSLCEFLRTEIKKLTWQTKLKLLVRFYNIIIQLKYWFDKINESKVLDEIKKIKKQFNDLVDNIQEIKMSDNVDEIIKQLKDWVNKINDSEDADKIKKQIKDKLDKIEGSDYINGIIKLNIKYQLYEIKGSDEVNEIQKHEIQKHEIIYWLDKIKGSCGLDEIKKQIKYWLNEIKGSNNLDEIKKQIIYWLDKIKGPDDIEKIKEQINYWVGKIKGLDNIDEITDQFLESDKIVSELPFNFPTHTDQMCTSKIIDTQQMSKLLTSKSIDTEIPEDSKQINLIMSEES
ncbi:kinase-like domain-containing protein [Gigaspora margarita]|uniref:Kinase-like domain-containing protein n=1 Tax=Gigaspora margarita TaxID=4874 RepID=A0A8H3XHS6_GIGMA|nr:kinase-like domain-containing protein [Gigaspora margarita]